MNGIRWSPSRTSAVTVLHTAAAALLSLGAGHAQTGAENLGLAAFSPSASHPQSGEVTVFTVSEIAQGGSDLNGDGDALDAHVVHVFDGCRRINLGLASQRSYFEIDGDLVAFMVSESRQGGRDLNGDGDSLDDHVLHVFDGATGRTTNLRLATLGLARLSDGLLAFAVSEPLQGTTDLNRDGDALDGHVVHLFDAGSGSVTNLGLAVRNFGESSIDRDLLLFSASEVQQGTDLNGDADVLDAYVLHAFVRATGRVVNSGVASAGATGGRLGDRVVFSASEIQEGTTLNGDGDALDAHVAHVFDPSTGTVTNLGIATERAGGRVRNGVAVLPVSEVLQGRDLNGDGDALDGEVPHVFDSATSRVINLRLAASRFVFDAELSDDLLAFTVSESLQGRTDLNGDGDSSDGDVVHVYHTATRTTSNLRLATGGGPLNSVAFFLADDVLAFTVSEASQGNVDLNGDGDALDGEIVHVFRGGSARAINLRLASLDFGVQVRAGQVLFTVSESQQGRVDLNGDGDAFDTEVLHLLGPGSGRATNLGVHVDRRPNWRFVFDVVFDGELAAFAVTEDAQGADLNGDGDRLDSVEHVLDVAGPTLTNLAMASLPPSRFAVMTVRKIVGDLVFYTVHELSQGNSDLNGDGDTNDRFVAHVHDTRTATTSNLGIETAQFTAVTRGLTWITHGTGERLPAPEWVSFAVSEIGQGADLNGDGDASDANVVHIVRVRPLALDADPERARAAVPLNIAVCGGAPGGPLLLLVTGVNGSPVGPSVLVSGRFGSTGGWSLQFVVPPGLAGLEVELQAVGVVAAQVAWSNLETIVFQ